MQMLDEIDEFEDKDKVQEPFYDMDENIEFEEKSDAKENKNKIPVKSFSNFIREYRKEGYDLRESMEMAFRKMHPLPKPKMFDLYCMSFFPEINLDSYKNSYILVGNELKYIKLNGKYEKKSVPITNMDVFLSEISKFESIVIEKRHLSSKHIKDIITLNGGHIPQKQKKQSKNKTDETKTEADESREFCLIGLT